MSHHSHVVIGAGMSGLAFAAIARQPGTLVVEAEQESGGYCRTVEQDGFTWDYSGHFFHFKHPEIEAWLRRHMPDDEIRTVRRRSFIHFADRLIDFPFQKNIHQLPQDDFIDCLYELHFRHERFPATETPGSFRTMLLQKFGQGIAERFLFPYNEKLYACDLDELDPDAMGRFFPWADEDDIIRNFRQPDNSSYNATFTYPRGGAIRYVRALERQLPPGTVQTNERALHIDLDRRELTTTRRTVTFDHLISSAPLPALLRMTGTDVPDGLLRSNRVLVFNLGFDAKGPRDLHWVYLPDRARRAYRVGFYDNIFETERMSLYVEIGLGPTEEADPEQELQRVLDDLRATGLLTTQRLVSSHHVLLDPAYVHITTESIRQVAELRARLARSGVHSIGRYGGWTYCSIEDNLLEARALAETLHGAPLPLP